MQFSRKIIAYVMLSYAWLNATDSNLINESNRFKKAVTVVACIILDQAIQTYYAPEGSNANLVTNMAIATAYALLPGTIEYVAGANYKERITLMPLAIGLYVAPKITAGSCAVAWALDKIAGRYVGNGIGKAAFDYCNARVGGMLGMPLPLCRCPN
ncbi:MAG: hypothetical protein NT128_00545 [Proteobacteria bacterium]|nr:hypothetical protein [Pseudomonadota bacterium]